MGVKPKPMHTIEQYKHIARVAFQLLSSHTSTLYNQATQCEKLNAIGVKVSKGLFNKMVNNKEVSNSYLIKITEGLELIIAQELGMIFDVKSKFFIANRAPDWKPSPILLTTDKNSSLNREPVFHHDGRRSATEKVAFIQEAQSSVIFLGLRLRQLVSYFSHRKEAEFKTPIKTLLSNGVNINCYLADPNSNKIKAYFADRAIIQKKDKYGEALIPDIIQDLKTIQAEFETENLAGSFRIFTYNHFPTTHFLAVDLRLPTAKLLASNYLYGISRSKLPVVEVHKAYHSSVYSLYQESLLALINGAKEL